VICALKFSCFILPPLKIFHRFLFCYFFYFSFIVIIQEHVQTYLNTFKHVWNILVNFFSSHTYLSVNSFLFDVYFFISPICVSLFFKSLFKLFYFSVSLTWNDSTCFSRYLRCYFPDKFGPLKCRNPNFR